MIKSLNLPERIRTSCRRVLQRAELLKINEAEIANFCASLKSSEKQFLEWNESDFHLVGKAGHEETTLSYIFTLDMLNFCFWPSDWEYDNLARALKKCVEISEDFLSAENLVTISLETVRDVIFGGLEFPLLEERVRILRELGSQTLAHFGGRYTNIVKAAEGSAVKLLDILTSLLPNLQDHSIYKGEQIFLYKRGQILIGDIWGSFKGEGLGAFWDIDQLTTFPDYRVPQILRDMKILEYVPSLCETIDSKTVIEHGSPAEVEIRAATVVAVELIKERLKSEGIVLNSVQIDWALWQRGEEAKDRIAPHHRTLSIFY
eukprot:TRINITY_DN3961_c0_g1_i2.p1 TRINITY_DN3961_c0_g1~~TRINITY_DN3961_c0_g1_i2.p1  ORF type:complete len:318 (-),score=69.52 TRINITY_DN3961_c0_g1_i2:584-1537(-)